MFMLYTFRRISKPFQEIAQNSQSPINTIIQQITVPIEYWTYLN